MYDKDIACHILQQVQHSVKIILTRFQPVKVVADFTDSPEGMEKFDSICMLLINVVNLSGHRFIVHAPYPDKADGHASLCPSYMLIFR